MGRRCVSITAAITALLVRNYPVEIDFSVVAVEHAGRRVGLESGKKCNMVASAWAEEHLAAHDLELAVFSGSLRGVRTQRARAPGEVIVTVPDELVMTAARAERQAEIADVIEVAGSAGSEEATLATWLLLEKSKGSASPWAHYLDLLQETLPSMFIFDRKLIGVLPQAYRSVVIAAADGVRALSNSSLPIRRKLAEEQSAADMLDWDAFKWAMMHVRSRAVRVQIDGRPTRALFPLLDLLNHDGTAYAKLKQGNGSWCMRSQKAFAPGEQLFITYGNHTKLEMLVHYGFSVCDPEGGSILFTSSDVVMAFVSAYPGLVEGAILELVEEELKGAENSLFAHSLASGPDRMLQNALSTLRQLGETLGAPDGSIEDAAVIHQMLQRRRDELQKTLASWCLESSAVHDFLEIESAAIEQALEASR